MEKVLNFTYPCTKKWDELSEKEPGVRHCDTCNKCVTNFTGLSSGQFNKKIKESEGDFCGVFNLSQLPGLYKSFSVNALKNISITVAGLLGVFATGEATAQTTVQADTVPAPDVVDTLQNTFPYPVVVSGRLRDKVTLLAAWGVKVELLQNGKVVKSVKTDPEGKFTIDIAEGELTDSVVTIKISYGFPADTKTTERRVRTENLPGTVFDLQLTAIPSPYLVEPVNSKIPELPVRKQHVVVGRVSTLVQSPSAPTINFINLSGFDF